MIQSAIGLARGFHDVSGVSICRPAPEFAGAFSKDAAVSPEGSWIPALRAAAISRRTSASDGAPDAMWHLAFGDDRVRGDVHLRDESTVLRRGGTGPRRRGIGFGRDRRRRRRLVRGRPRRDGCFAAARRADAAARDEHREGHSGALPRRPCARPRSRACTRAGAVPSCPAACRESDDGAFGDEQFARFS